MSETQIIYADLQYIDSFYETLKVVAAEKIYIETIEPVGKEKVREFQKKLIDQDGPVFYAIKDNKVIGWIDVFPMDNPRQCHRGNLGMGILPEFREKGLGTKLVEKVISKSKEFGLEKIELTVYTSNQRAINLYKKLGFVEEGLIKKYRKLEGEYFDCLSMAYFL